jgi:uncharacterized protein YjbI with pentapeptide repeats
MATQITNQTFTAADLTWKNYADVEFVGCIFNGKAVGCNFVRSVFTGCTFANDFAFERCLLVGSTGLPERFPVQPLRGVDAEPTLHPAYLRRERIGI